MLIAWKSPKRRRPSGRRDTWRKRRRTEDKLSSEDDPPPPLTGQAALDFIEQTKQHHAARMAQNLAREKEAAARDGKEVFDLERLEALFGGEITTEDYRPIPHEKRRADLEYEYYIDCRSLRTLAAFADYLKRALRG